MLDYKKFLRFLQPAFSGAMEATIEEISNPEFFQGNVGLIERISECKTALADLGLESVPDFSAGEIDTMRLLKRKLTLDDNMRQFESDIAKGEGPCVEFKSSFCFDWNRYSYGEYEDAKDLRSAEVESSALRAVAGMINSGGGRLYIGIADDGEILGIESDFQYIGKGEPRDQWELYFRSKIRSAFVNGKSVVGFVDICFLSLVGKTLACVNLSVRSKLVFVQDSRKGTLLFERKGNQTLNIKMEDIEDFFARRQQITEMHLP